VTTPSTSTGISATGTPPSPNKNHHRPSSSTPAHSASKPTNTTWATTTKSSSGRHTKPTTNSGPDPWSVGGPSGCGSVSRSPAPASICLVADNAGRELLPDRVLIDHLLATGQAHRVDLHLRPNRIRTTFSDAMTANLVAACAGRHGGWALDR